MSWQTYVDVNLVGTKHIAKAAIIGLKGGVWAKSPGFDVSADEQKALIEGFTNPTSVQASGLHIAGKKYFTLQVNDRSYYGKQGPDGISCVKTNQAVLIGLYVSPTQPGDANKTVEGLADYLIGSGY
ncbi:profilin, required for normal timing of actin polymerization in response to thermal stress [Tilletia horrida]|uniref:Profilin n=1 Tax=Tilletia horrida TaxID=155126 RepID=A0AAN6GCE2_9BASI|nr:profilin, required for normal timing of actin polymerization in response to thermal stress [Tilletia horrida]KAK0534364.1 profilin, required for normal timing of actin polymerization in response to thermal stress [Tilletia horrida]KAK0537698.1 profilin, required for normal timing of actin polymerization in response to thermal stress [Tilletia horrida]KAK0560015.1 profilin, required for normal timing of actin polymerization in response to thermal stress [Tilletia horrida]